MRTRCWNCPLRIVWMRCSTPMRRCGCASSSSSLTICGKTLSRHSSCAALIYRTALAARTRAMSVPQQPTPLEAIFQKISEHETMGELDDAENLLVSSFGLEPVHPHAIHLSGVLA